MGITENVRLNCPFCGKETIKTIYIPPFFQAHTSRSSASGSKTTYYKTKEKYQVQSSCPNCGKSAKQIQKALDEGVKDPEKEKKILKRLKDQGLDFSNVVTKF